MKITRKGDRYRSYVPTPDGKYQQIYGKTKREVKQKANRLIKEIENREWVKRDNTRFGDWCDTWIKNYTNHLKPRTFETYKQHIEIHIKPYFKNKKIQDIAHNDVQEFVNHLTNIRSPKTVRNIHSVVNLLMRDAIKNDLISKNPASEISLPKIPRQEMKIIPENKLQDFINSCYKVSEYANMIEFALLTGLRQSELIGVTFSRYNPYNYTLTIDRQYQHKKGFLSPKHDVVRVIELNDRCVDIIEEQRKKREENGFETDFVFFNKDGHHVPHRTLAKHYKRIVKAIGLPELRFHDLRHTYATYSIISGTDIKTLQYNLGHASASFTLNRYGHTTDRAKRESANRLGSFISNLKFT